MMTPKASPPNQVGASHHQFIFACLCLPPKAKAKTTEKSHELLALITGAAVFGLLVADVDGIDAVLVVACVVSHGNMSTGYLFVFCFKEGCFRVA
ncbi:hypothetical protein Pyn_22563 [Prunus yedoensis var. nudiflora]|uniref:Uncharacterized protein n=1 Tax=Prunus yedoensis var. nudiflora TaxID=2094558 RepID=A0A314ZDF7_PRUYE|nr:hypothetical protein Pyn_22563 [Prunus yedoensis var. nudiflora]